MQHHPLLGPVAALLGWSVVMFVWMYATRIPAMLKAGLDLKNLVGGQGRDLDSILPPKVQWKAHNYNHLMEQPTLFYAACFALVLMAFYSQGALYAAWGYVGLRIAHSLVQSLSNRIRYRFGIFLLASFCLIYLVVATFAAAFA
jgi:hypothetical protein